MFFNQWFILILNSFILYKNATASTIDQVLNFQDKLKYLKLKTIYDNKQYSYNNEINQVFKAKIRKRRDVGQGSSSSYSKNLELLLVIDKATQSGINNIKDFIDDIYSDVKENYHVLDLNVILLKYHLLTEDEDAIVYKDIRPSGQSGSEVNADKLLTQFNDWRKDKSEKYKNLGSTEARIWKNYDTAHLISGYDFSGSTVGLAYLKSVCSSQSKAGINQYTNNNNFMLSSIITHELGHNLGLTHDQTDGTCECSVKGSAACLMSPTLSNGGTHQWSSCSKENFGKLSSNPCLNNDIDPDLFYDEAVCGDGMVTGDEECDCGQNQLNSTSTCNNDCCDAITCKLKTGKQCDQGLCCDDQCGFRPLAFECRPSTGECDLKEVCTGLHALCPIDVQKRHSENCEDSDGNDGYCYEGRCQSGHDQCKEIYGEDAYYDDDCYDNKNSVDFDTDNPPCGYLLCKFSWRNNIDESQMTEIGNGCYRLEKTEDQLPYFVNTGTYCTISDFSERGTCQNKYCQKWIDPTSLASKSCPGTTDLDGKSNYLECNGHGECNSEGNCHCDCGYAPPYCLHRGEGGSVDSATTCPDNFMTIIIILLILLFVVLPIVFILLIYWYLKRYNYEVSVKGFLDLMGIVDDRKPTKRTVNNRTDSGINQTHSYSPYTPDDGNAVRGRSSTVDSAQGFNINRDVPNTNNNYQTTAENAYSMHPPSSSNTGNVWGDPDIQQPTSGPALPRRDYDVYKADTGPTLPARDYPRR